MNAGAPRPFPLQPLLDAGGITQGVLGHLVNANGSAVKKAAEDGLTLSEADRWSHRLGFMAEEVWPDIFLAIPEGSAA